jgi:hypothetical protein
MALTPRLPLRQARTTILSSQSSHRWGLRSEPVNPSTTLYSAFDF